MAKEELECSFCGRKKPETNLLIAGLDAHICDRCIEQAHQIVLEESSEFGLKKAIELLENSNLKDDFQENRKKLLENSIDVTSFIVWFIENYPKSKERLKEDPNYI